MFYQKALPKFRFLSIACIKSEMDTGEQQLLHSKKPNQQIHSVCMEPVPFHVGCLFCMGAYKRTVVVVIKMGAYILVLCPAHAREGGVWGRDYPYSWSAYFV